MLLEAVRQLLKNAGEIVIPKEAKKQMEQKILSEQSFKTKNIKIENKKVTIYPSAASATPVIYLNTFAEEEGDCVHRTLCDMSCPDFTLVVISGLEWNHDMVLWDIPPVSKNDAPYTKGADEYLQLMIEQIIPNTEKYMQGSIAWRGLAGYSLAGLFAVYSMYQTTLFSRIASKSGSLWFPDFKEYVFSNEPMHKPDHLFLSGGDRECKTKNPYLKTVQSHTEAIEAFYRGQGIDTILCMNAGGHFKDTAKRTASGIRWLLSKPAKSVETTKDL